MKLDRKKYNGYQKIKSSNTLDFDLSYNDAWNIANYNITRDEYDYLLRLDRKFNFHDRTIKEIQNIIDEKWI